MITANYSPNYNYSQNQTGFGRRPTPKTNLKKELQDFARNIKLTSLTKTDLPKELFPDASKYVTSVELQIIKPEKGILPANYRAVNLVVNSKKGLKEPSSSTWLKTGTVPELQDYLRQNPTEVTIANKVKTLSEEAFDRPETDI